MKLNQKQASTLFNGNRYNSAKVELFTGFVEVLKIAPVTAILLAEAAITDYTKSNANGQASVKFGTTTKGNMSVKDMFTTKMGATPAMQIAHLIQWFGEVGKHGGKYLLSNVPLVDSLNEYVTKLAKDADDKVIAAHTAKLAEAEKLATEELAAA